MQSGDLLRHSQAEAVALGLVGSIALIKLVKDARLGGFVHAGAVVAHRDGHALRIAVQRQRHRAACGRKLEGVVQQVHPHFFEQRRAARVDTFAVLRQFDREGGLFFVRPFLLHQQCALAQLLRQREGRGVGQNALRFDTGQRQHAVGEPGQAAALGRDDGEILPPLFGRHLLVLQQQGGKTADRGDGGLEFMRKVVDEIFAQDLRSAQFLRRFVERGGKLPQFQRAHPAVAGHAHAEIAARQPLHRAHHAAHRLQDNQPDHDHHADRQQHRHRIQQHCHSRRVQQLFYLRPAQPHRQPAAQRRDGQDGHQDQKQVQHQQHAQVDGKKPFLTLFPHRPPPFSPRGSPARARSGSRTPASRKNGCAAG